ncbi:hypothetical protein [Thiofilum flexile]|uniref:hypothetical protein n=1 Tax=Thiofilum flexile TaxID=125627 RepID=UPI0003619AFE|nr:hypothetical protein [Thiofilum flexile]
MSTLFKPLVMALMISAVSLVSFTQANPVEEKVNLIATIANQPAFKPVTWEVYRIDRDGKDKLLKKEQNRHAFTLGMQPGVYAAVATYDNQKKRRYEFTVKANTPRDLFVPID